MPAIDGLDGLHVATPYSVFGWLSDPASMGGQVAMRSRCQLHAQQRTCRMKEQDRFMSHAGCGSRSAHEIASVPLRRAIRAPAVPIGWDMTAKRSDHRTPRAPGWSGPVSAAASDSGGCGPSGLCRALCATGPGDRPGLAGRGFARRGRRSADRRPGAPAGRRDPRPRSGGLGGIEDFLHAYSLSTKEGLALMVLAEALLRVPDAATADALIEDKLAAGDWSEPDTLRQRSWFRPRPGRSASPRA